MENISPMGSVFPLGGSAIDIANIYLVEFKTSDDNDILLSSSVLTRMNGVPRSRVPSAFSGMADALTWYRSVVPSRSLYHRRVIILRRSSQMTGTSACHHPKALIADDLSIGGCTWQHIIFSMIKAFILIVKTISKKVMKILFPGETKSQEPLSQGPFIKKALSIDSALLSHPSSCSKR